MVKNLPAKAEETQVRSLGQEDPLEEGMATHSSTLAWRIPWTEGAWLATVHGVMKSHTKLSDSFEQEVNVLLQGGGRAGETPTQPREGAAPGMDVGAAFRDQRLKPTLGGCGRGPVARSQGRSGGRGAGARMRVGEEVLTVSWLLAWAVCLGGMKFRKATWSVCSG